MRKLSLLALTVCLSLSAQENAQGQEKLLFKEQEIHESENSILPSARDCSYNSGFYSEFEFLYWRGRNEGFPFTFENKSAVDFSVIGNLVRLDDKWDPGFKLAFGWNTEYDAWDIKAQWAYYHNHSSKEIRATTIPNQSLGLLALWHRFSVGGPYAYSKASWVLNHNMFDLEMGRDYFVGCHLAFRPHLGLRGGSLHQTLRVKYKEPSVSQNNVFQSTLTTKNEYWGVGPRAGVQGDWRIGNGFAIFGDLATSLLCGASKLNQKETLLFIPPNLPENLVDINDDFNQLVPHLQMTIGLSWGSCFCKDFFFGLKAGWEVNYYWNQFHALSLSGNRTSPLTTLIFNQNQPITLEGISLQAKLDF